MSSTTVNRASVPGAEAAGVVGAHGSHLRVLHVVGDSKFGGEALVVRDLAHLAKSLGWDVEVLATDEHAKRFYKESGIGVVALDAIHRSINPIHDLAGLWKVYRFLKAHRYDVVHTHTSKGGVIGRLAARMARVPTVIHTAHGFAFHEESSRAALLVYSMIERFAARCCDRVVTVSQFHRDWAVELGIAGPEKIVAIPNGISADAHAQVGSPVPVRAAWGIAPEELLIVATSRLAPQKGLEYLISAVPIIERSFGGPFRILLAGTGELERELTDLCQRLEVQRRVRFLGFQKDTGGLLSAADIVALPSLWEGLSISLLEAMVAGKAIITTAIGSNREVVKDDESAVVVPPKNSVELAHGLVRLMKDQRLRERLGTRAACVVRTQFTVERMVDQYRTLYLGLVHE